MTKDDIKHALVSLILGILITAGTSLMAGLLHIATLWISGYFGGVGTSVAYLQFKDVI